MSESAASAVSRDACYQISENQLTGGCRGDNPAGSLALVPSACVAWSSGLEVTVLHRSALLTRPHSLECR
jgi:hypothetical protein